MGKKNREVWGKGKKTRFINMNYQESFIFTDCGAHLGWPAGMLFFFFCAVVVKYY